MSGTREQTKIPLPLEPHESWLILDDATIGVHFAAWFLNFVLSGWGIDLAEEFSQKSWETLLADHPELFHDALLAALDLNQDDLEGVHLEKAAKFCARGELARAGLLIRRFIEERIERGQLVDEANTGRRRQSKHAKRPRPDTLSKLIYQLVEITNGEISESELKDELESNKWNPSGIVEDIEGGVVYFVREDNAIGETKIANLRGRLSRAKIRFKEDSSR